MDRSDHKNDWQTREAVGRENDLGNWCFPQKANSSHVVSELDSLETTTATSVL